MPEQIIDKKTCWECQLCGNCCRGIILTKNKSISVEKDGQPVCKFLDDDNRCVNYNDRPFICCLYPFVIDLSKIVDEKGTARPRKAFELENLRIHDECPGYGKGKRIYANKNIQRKLEKLGEKFAYDLKAVFEKKKDVNELM
ncbi:MAG: YkgJ family cysteine cluster protein [Nanoarchaeota archaeon]|nr:YkgJ family cysteine cluster protein [Nanoarchaeota archaeon]